MTDRKAIECIDGMGFTSYKEFTALVIAQDALQEREERSKGCQHCKEIWTPANMTQVEYIGGDEWDFCPWCGRPMKGADDGTD